MTRKKVDGKKKCACVSCQCQVGPPDEFCSDYCSGAEETAQIDVQCSCGHACCIPGEPMFDPSRDHEHPLSGDSHE